MVFEYMDHDLTGLADRPGMRFTVPQIKVLLLTLSVWYIISILVMLELFSFFASATCDSCWLGCITVM